MPAGIEVGDPIEVFLYKDSSDRIIATTRIPKLMMGEVKVLEVADTARIGAFLDWGLEKRPPLPFREQTAKVSKKDKVLVALYVDKSGRLCATMKVYDKLCTDAPYEKDAEVKGRIYEISDNFGAFVAVDDKYSALIPKREAYGNLKVGMEVECRVTKVHEDGKLDLSVRKKAFEQMDDDAVMILGYVEKKLVEVFHLLTNLILKKSRKLLELVKMHSKEQLADYLKSIRYKLRRMELNLRKNRFLKS